MGLLFKVIEKCWQNAEVYKDNDIDFYLEESDWNDYGYETSYCVHASRKLTKGDNEYLGSIRIMSMKQKKGDRFLLRTTTPIVFSELPKDFISLSMDLDLFTKINQLLSMSENRLEFVKAIHLILGEDSEYYNSKLNDNECFMKSLLRDSSMNDNFVLQKAKSLIYDSTCYYDLREKSFNVKFSHIEKSIDFNFTSIKGEDNSIIPNGILVFIGKNGSGKSTSIYKLAKLLYTDPTRRFLLQAKVGHIRPNNIGVSKMFLISYSPFDNFVLPIIEDDEYINFLKLEEDVKSRFVYCGIRDISSELDCKKKDNGEFKIVNDRQGEIALKEVSDLSIEFWQAFLIIAEKKEWQDFLISCQKYQPSLYKDIESLDVMSSKEEIIERFKSLSTGHKYFLHSYARVLSCIENNSLLMFDEPENHLHPPLLSFMIAEYRKILSMYGSVMFISTHSPVIVQETFADNVYIVRKLDTMTSISHPIIETYGANLSTIMSEVFDLTTETTKYHDVIEQLYHSWGMESFDDLDDMLSQFEKRLGHHLSDQMESYLINLYCQDHVETE